LCGPKPPKDNSAELARRQEEKRQADILAGRGKIDEAFAGFNDPFYSGIEKAYGEYYFPQLDRQFQDANEKLKLKLASAGLLNSGKGAELLGDLQETYGIQRGQIASGAIDRRNQVRGDVERAREDLFALNQSAADPAAIAVQAQSRAGSLQAPRGYDPIGNAFADFIGNLAIPVAAERRGYPGTGTGIFAPKGSGKGSQRVVG
jgi:hypothetical protein